MKQQKKINKSILFITVTFPPRLSVASLRLYHYSKLFIKNGWTVKIISAKQYGEMTSHEFDLDELEIIHVNWKDPFDRIQRIRHPLIRKIIFKSMNAFVPYLATWLPDYRFKSWRKSVFKKSIELIEKDNVNYIYSSFSPPSPLMVSQQLKQRYPNITWIAEFRDLMSYSHGLSKFKRPFSFIHSYFEKKLLKKADEILCVSQGHADFLKSKLNREVNTLYNGCDFELYTNIQKNKNNSFTILYTGHLYLRKYNYTMFFKALSRVIQKTDKRIKFIFLGTNKNRNLFRLIDDLNLKEVVEFKKKIPNHEVRHFQKSANLLLHFCWNDKTQNGNLTGKLFEYISSRTPILSIGDQSEVGKLIKETHSGTMCNNSNEIEHFITEIINNELILEPLTNENCLYSKETQFKLLEKRLLKF